MKLFLWLAVTFACASLAACQAQHSEPEPAHQADSGAPDGSEAEIPTLEYLGTELRKYGYEDDPYYRFMDIIRFSNRTPVAWEFWGERVTWPLWSRGYQTGSGTWETERRIIVCGSGLGPLRIAPGQTAEFPAHSARSIIPGEPVRFSRVELQLTNVVTGEQVTAVTDGYLPEIAAEDEAFRATLDKWGEPHKPRGPR